jgi:mxaA protein
VRQAARQRLELDYQLFAAAASARKLELPTLALIVEPPAGLAGATPRELRLPARPLWLVSLASGAPGNQSGLGEMRPDVPVQGVSTAVPARQLVTSLLVGLAMLLLGLAAPALLRWLGVSARAQPFNQASREIRRLLRRRSVIASRQVAVTLSTGDGREAAWHVLHQAFDRSAGRTLLPRQARSWAEGDARYAALADDVERFFAASAERFFGVGVVGQAVGVSWSRRSSGGEPVRRRGAGGGAANDDRGFDEAHLLQLAKALARAEAARLASRGGRRAAFWLGQRGRRHG